jgi:hypothetical protein
MVHVLIPPLPPGACNSDYVLVEERLCTRERQTVAKLTIRTLGISCMCCEVQLAGCRQHRCPQHRTEGEAKILTILDQVLAAAFTHDSGNPRGATLCPTRAQYGARTHFPAERGIGGRTTVV